MAVKETVKGHCGDSKCTYDVYTKEKIDELLRGKQNVSLDGVIDFDNIKEIGIYVIKDTAEISNFPSTPFGIDDGAVLQVYTSTLGQTGLVYQKLSYAKDILEPYYRSYNSETQTWTEWTKTKYIPEASTKEEVDQIKETINEKLIEIKTITGSYSRSSGGDTAITTKTISYPEGFNKENSILLAIGTKKTNNSTFPDYVFGSTGDTASDVLQAGTTRRIVRFKASNIELGFSGVQASDALTVDYKLVIAKIVAINE